MVLHLLETAPARDIRHEKDVARVGLPSSYYIGRCLVRGFPVSSSSGLAVRPGPLPLRGTGGAGTKQPACLGEAGEVGLAAQGYQVGVSLVEGQAVALLDGGLVEVDQGGVG